MKKVVYVALIMITMWVGYVVGYGAGESHTVIAITQACGTGPCKLDGYWGGTSTLIQVDGKTVYCMYHGAGDPAMDCRDDEPAR